MPKLQARLVQAQECGELRAIPEEELEVVAGIFRFAETNRPATGFGAVSNDEIEYRAEYNTWCYYCELLPSFKVVSRNLRSFFSNTSKTN